MHLAPVHRRLAAWFAALALLLAAIAPTLSLAAGLANRAPWGEVCSAQEPKSVRGDAGAPAGKNAGAHLFEHCPCCSIHVPTFGPPQAPWVWHRAAEPAAQRAFVRLAAPHPVQPWASAQPRAPPALS